MALLWVPKRNCQKQETGKKNFEHIRFPWNTMQEGTMWLCATARLFPPPWCSFWKRHAVMRDPLLVQITSHKASATNLLPVLLTGTHWQVQIDPCIPNWCKIWRMQERFFYHVPSCKLLWWPKKMQGFFLVQKTSTSEACGLLVTTVIGILNVVTSRRTTTNAWPPS